MNNDVKLGKFISLILRHKPETINIKLDENGWADTKELIEKISKSGREIDFETLERIVNQGHSIEVNLELKEVVPPVVLYHGTAFKNVESIKKEGIKKMERQHVHLSADLETAKNVATRHSSKYVILEIDTEAMLKENYKFYLSENKVWLTDFVPSKFIKF